MKRAFTKKWNLVVGQKYLDFCKILKKPRNVSLSFDATETSEETIYNLKEFKTIRFFIKPDIGEIFDQIHYGDLLDGKLKPYNICRIHTKRFHTRKENTLSLKLNFLLTTALRNGLIGCMRRFACRKTERYSKLSYTSLLNAVQI